MLRDLLQGRIQEFFIGGVGGGGGVQTLVQKGLSNFLEANYCSQRRPRVSQSGRRSPLAREILLFEQRRTDHRRVSPKHKLKSMTFLNIPEI